MRGPLLGDDIEVVASLECDICGDQDTINAPVGEYGYWKRNLARAVRQAGWKWLYGGSLGGSDRICPRCNENLKIGGK